MRIAWIGPVPNEGGGSAQVATQLIRGLANRGETIDLYITGELSELSTSLQAIEGVEVISREPSRWLSQPFRRELGPEIVRFIGGQTGRALAQRQLASSLLARHSERPYEVVFQFSQIELFSLRSRRRSLPPLLLHPGVHAAGELAWHRREAAISRRCEPLARRTAARAMLIARAAIQDRDLRLADGIVVPSRTFGKQIRRDHSLDPRDLAVVPHPVDLARFKPAREDAPLTAGRSVLMFVGRLAVRKGIEMIVDLSHRLDDLADSVEIRMIGDHSMWSNYAPLADDLNPRTATYVGHRSPAQLSEEYRKATLLLAPSHYEPFGLTVAEALASGTPVIASDQVGAAEDLPRTCARRYPHEDAHRFEREVRGMLEELRDDGRAFRRAARAEAKRRFSEASAAELLEGTLRHFAGHAQSESPARSPRCLRSEL